MEKIDLTADPQPSLSATIN